MPVLSDGPQGVGGWLLFYCVSLTVLSPVVVSNQFQSLGPRLSLSYLIDATRVVYGMIVGIFLWTKHAMALSLLRVYFGVVAAIAILAVLGLILAGLQSGWDSVPLSPAFTPVLQTIGYTIIWFSYFHKSRRVRNTYGANL